MKGIPYMYSEHTKRLKTERNKRNIWNINDWEFPQIPETLSTDPGSSENNEQVKVKQNNKTNYT